MTHFSFTNQPTADKTPMSPFKGFLTAKWFDPANASLLRGHLKARIHGEMAAQAADVNAAAAVQLVASAGEYTDKERR